MNCTSSNSDSSSNNSNKNSESKRKRKRYKKALYVDYKEHEVSQQTHKKWMSGLSCATDCTGSEPKYESSSSSSKWSHNGIK